MSSPCPFPPEGSHDLVMRLRVILAREWVAERGGQEMVERFDRLLAEGRLTWTTDIVQYVEQVLDACKTGQVCPGYGFSADEPFCVMDLVAFSCFGRWYAVMDPMTRQSVLRELAGGNPAPWTAQGMPPGPSPCEPDTPITDQWCCPPRVWTDPFYGAKRPTKRSSSKFWAYGLGASIGLAALVFFWRRK